VTGARPSTSYTALLRSPGGTTTALGTVGPTDKAGNGTLVVPSAFAASTIGSGAIVLQSSSTDEFVSGFRVDQKICASGSFGVEPGSLWERDRIRSLRTAAAIPLDRGSYEDLTRPATQREMRRESEHQLRAVLPARSDNSGT